MQKSEQTPNPLPASIPIPTLPLRTWKPKWEKALPKSYIIVAMEENPTSLKLKVEIETMDTAETKSVTALLPVQQVNVSTETTPEAVSLT